MSRRTDVQDATGRLEYLAGRGTIQAWGAAAPANGTTGFAPGCTWQDLSSGKVYVNLGTFASSQWLQNDSTSGSSTRFGAATLGANFYAFTSEGNIYRNAGAPIAGNAANTSDNVLDGFVLPANSFDVANRGLSITVAGNTAANGNNKRVRIWANPTMSGQTVTAGVISGGTVTGAGSGVLLLDSGAQTGNNVGWWLTVNWFKYGAAGGNTQAQSGAQFAFGSTHGGTTLSTSTTLTESAAINIVVTGASQTTGAAGDVTLWWTQINANN